MHRSILVLAATAVAASVASAQKVRVAVSAENLAPEQATFQTPVWVGFHDGTFDTHDVGRMANELPIAGSQALERLAEDGDTSFLMSDFTMLGMGAVQATVPGPNGPIAPCEIARGEFLLDPLDPRARYFSYVSMVIPSNDAFIANDSPTAHPVFDAGGALVARNFFVIGSDVKDAGTEVNDELPVNTAFLGQMAPNTGVTEGAPIAQHLGFNPRGSGGILDDARFADADFVEAGYPMVRFRFRAATAYTDVRDYEATATGADEVPPVVTSATASLGAILLNSGTELQLFVVATGLNAARAAHLHLGAAGTNGPVVVDLVPGASFSMPTPGTHRLDVAITSASLTGPLAGYPLDALVGAMEAGDVYLNIHTAQNPAGEIRGQVTTGL